jgi:hypothetical protein
MIQITLTFSNAIQTAAADEIIIRITKVKTATPLI